MDFRQQIEKRVAELKAYSKDYRERVPESEVEDVHFNAKDVAFSYAARILQRDLDFFEAADVVGSTVKADEKAHYEALKECCQKLLKTVDEGKVPQKEIVGLRILFGK